MISLFSHLDDNFLTGKIPPSLNSLCSHATVATFSKNCLISGTSSCHIGQQRSPSLCPNYPKPPPVVHPPPPFIFTNTSNGLSFTGKLRPPLHKSSLFSQGSFHFLTTKYPSWEIATSLNWGDELIWPIQDQRSCCKLFFLPKIPLEFLQDNSFFKKGETLGLGGEDYRGYDVFVR